MKSVLLPVEKFLLKECDGVDRMKLHKKSVELSYLGSLLTMSNFITITHKVIIITNLS